MALPLNDDLAAILNIEEFAVTATYVSGNYEAQSTISGIFDNETIPVETGGFMQVHQEQPRFTCRTIDLGTLSEDSQLTVNNVEYAIKAWVHDGTGMTVLQLEKAE